MRQLTNREKYHITLLTNYSVELTLIEPTKTGLAKSIMDATIPVRSYLKEQGIHDYDLQQAGQNHKVIIEDTIIVTPNSYIPSRTSLYRPKAKGRGGDPRIWFKHLPEFSMPNDILMLTYFNNYLYVINITQLDVYNLIHAPDGNPLKELVNEVYQNKNSISNELLRKIQLIANSGPLRAIKHGDTAIGHALEAALGIPENNSKSPDYKGIELKSYRSKPTISRESRKTLFTQVPNWKLSYFKSSRDILNAFGYQRNDGFRLNCTTSTKGRNSQGLILRLEKEDISQLIENSDNVGDFVVWLMDDLKSRLLEKHYETFWIGADSIFNHGIEYFQYKKILHTKNPIPAMFELLVEQGEITLDHMIKRTSTGGASERGPSFKISNSALSMLFPEQVEYNLVL